MELYKKGPYLSLEEVSEIYRYLAGSKDLKSFLKAAKSIASKTTKVKAFIFKDEEKLFGLFKESIPDILAKRGISNFNQLIDYLP